MQLHPRPCSVTFAYVLEMDHSLELDNVYIHINYLACLMKWVQNGLDGRLKHKIVKNT